MMEPALYDLLKTLCPRVYPDVAPQGTEKPYMTWQAIGGEVARYLDNTAADKRNTLMQINAWALTRQDATTLIRQAEDALCGSAAFVARPQGEALSMYEPDTKLYGSVQRFSVWASR
jgi:hypothetical protein